MRQWVSAPDRAHRSSIHGEEARRYPNMQKVLSLYRLAFGQPEQSELLQHLKSLDLDSDVLAYQKHPLMIRLAPIL
ncbi:hypothetical protein [Pseudomonas putida]|uniref:hypothetical protein n=1 Tax=Pseudomonas putida TaxID=303 RepID=UPI000CB35582|nr:hypothetical protein [Pseudomonas putida]PNG87783.1 hypothetical protein CBL13_01651 [Pseudomonas putida]